MIFVSVKMEYVIGAYPM